MLKFDHSICHSSHHVVEVWSCEMKWQESHSTYYSWTVTTSPASTNSYAVHTKVSVCLKVDRENLVRQLCRRTRCVKYLSVCLCVCVCVCVCLSESPCMVSPYLKCIAAFIRVNLDLCTWERGWGVIVWVNELVSEWVSEWVSVWVIEWVGEWAIEWVSDWMSEWLMSECTCGSVSHSLYQYLACSPLTSSTALTRTPPIRSLTHSLTHLLTHFPTCSPTYRYPCFPPLSHTLSPGRYPPLPELSLVALWNSHSSGPVSTEGGGKVTKLLLSDQAMLFIV